MCEFVYMASMRTLRAAAVVAAVLTVTCIACSWRPVTIRVVVASSHDTARSSVIAIGLASNSIPTAGTPLLVDLGSGRQSSALTNLTADGVIEEPKSVTWSELNSTWTAQVLQQQVPLSEYPRPLLVRNGVHQILNGIWEYAVSDIGLKDPPHRWDGPIRVPFAFESRLSA